MISRSGETLRVCHEAVSVDLAVARNTTFMFCYTSLVVRDYGPLKHPGVTKPCGRFTLHNHCGKSGSYTLALDGIW